LTLISSIGNSGDANLIGSLIPYVESQDKDISSSAVLAMENMSGENANKIIKKLLGNNTLKSNALYVLSKSPSSKYQLDLAISFFEKESDPELKIQSLKIISSNSRFFKNEVTEYLDKVKSKDPNPKIRNSALNLLISL
jgi:HEAT repeat protein